MSSVALGWAKSQMPRKANGDPDPIAKHILLQLCSMANSNSEMTEQTAWPSHRHLMEQTGWGKTAISHALARLEDGRYISRQRRNHSRGEHKGFRTSDLITILVDNSIDDVTSRPSQPESLKRIMKDEHAPKPNNSNTPMQAVSTSQEDPVLNYSNYKFNNQSSRWDNPPRNWTFDDIDDEVCDLIQWFIGSMPTGTQNLKNELNILRNEFAGGDTEIEFKGLKWIFCDQKVISFLMKDPNHVGDLILDNLRHFYSRSHSGEREGNFGPTHSLNLIQGVS